jgi:tRNA pseudouridine55 synthase
MISAQMAGERRRRVAVDGVLLLDKPIGPSSTKVLGHVKHLLNASKAGHGGTLDPLASGLLPLMFGESTKYAAEGLDADKGYRAEILLGRKTSTGDAEGEVIAEATVPPLGIETIQAVLETFKGAQQQIPPMYSALKKDGKALYAYAREGQEIDRAPRDIVIHELSMVAWDSPVLTVDLRCSKGTYVRSLAEDIGQALGLPATLAALRRTAVGQLSTDDLVPLEAIETASPDDRKAFLKPVDWLIRDWPAVVLSAEAQRRFQQGQVIVVPPGAPGLVRVLSASQEFLGTGRLAADSRLHPERVRVLTS